MKIKRFMFVVIASFLCIMTSAQKAACDSVVIANEDSCNTETIQSAIDACILFAEYSQSNDIDTLRNVRDMMQKCNFIPFASLYQQDKEADESLEGHLVFNVAFADSLIEGKNAYMNADSINKVIEHRGQMEPGQILTKTFLIKANGKSVYNFNPHGRLELAVVAEPGGLVTTRLHAVNKDKGVNEWHNDTTDVSKGRNSRKTTVNLPHRPRSQVTLEITNCTNKDISVVVISN